MKDLLNQEQIDYVPHRLNKMNFSHFIITQFNLKNFPLSDTNYYVNWLKWTRNRVELFREFCLPSITNQTCKTFTWLLYFDVDTPQEFNEFLNELNSLSFIKICYCKSFDDFNLIYTEEVKKRVGKSVKWIITTRIDNDDCFHKDAIKIIQDNFVEKHKYLISLASGYVLNISDRKLSHYFYPMSPFLSLIETTDNEIGCVFEKGHTKWDSLHLSISKEIWLNCFNKKARKSQFILKGPLWLQTVHGGNISNSFYRGFPVLKERDLSDFSINFRNNKQPIAIIRKYWNYVMWKRYLKCLIVKTIFKK
jgi:hypothetical protein